MTDDTVVFGRITIDLGGHCVYVDGAPIKMSNLEYDVLVFLAREPYRLFSREEISMGVWRSVPDFRNSRTLVSHMARVRCKLRRAGVEAVRNVHGRGYSLAIPA